MPAFTTLANADGPMADNNTRDRQADPSGYLGNILNTPVTITSGYRSPQRNAQVGGVPNSAHLMPGQAYDFVPQGMTTGDATRHLVKSGIPFDQIYDEGDHVHISFDPRGRRQVLGRAKMEISDEQLLQALTGESSSAPQPSASTTQQVGISDEELLAALTGEKPSASTSNRYPPGDSRNGPAAVTVGGGGQAQSTQALPPKFSKDSGIAGSLGLPFLQDVMAGMATAEDVAGNALTGRPGMSIGDTFQARSQELQDRSKEFQAQYPGMKNAWVLGLLPGGEASAASAIGDAAKAGLPNMMKAGARTGALFGGLYGLGTPNENDSVSGRVANAGQSAMTGAAVGMGLPVLGRAARIGAGGIGKILNALSETFGITSRDTAQEAENMLLRAFGHDSTNAPAASSQLAQTGKPLTIMDVGGTNTQRLARKLVTQPGQAGEKITKFLTERSEDQSGRVLGDITHHLSDNTDVYGVADQLTKERSATSKPLWDKAMNEVPVTTDRLKAFAADPDIQAGMKEGITLARREALSKGEKFDPNAYAITDFDAAGDPKIGPVPTWRTWQAAKEGLDERIESFRDKTTGRLPSNKTVNSLVDLKNSLLKELDAVNPSYKEARAAWAGPSQSKTSMSMGEDFLTADPEQITGAMSRMSDGDKDFYRIGAARSMQDRANSAADSADLSKRLFGNSRIRSQIEAVFGKGSADAFGEAMGHEGRMASTNRFVLGGSNTANKLADFTDPGELVAHDMLHGGLVGGPKGAVMHAGINAARRGISSLFDVHPETAAALGEILTQKGETAVPTLNRLLEAQAKKAARNKLLQTSAGLGNSLAARTVIAGRASQNGRSTPP